MSVTGPSSLDAAFTRAHPRPRQNPLYGYSKRGRAPSYGARSSVSQTPIKHLSASSYDPTEDVALQPYGYTGRRYDQETGLWYFRARYFDDTLGRFIARDPLGYVDGLSMYRGYFVPRMVDPMGLTTGPLPSEFTPRPRPWYEAETPEELFARWKREERTPNFGGWGSVRRTVHRKTLVFGKCDPCESCEDKADRIYSEMEIFMYFSGDGRGKGEKNPGGTVRIEDKGDLAIFNPPLPMAVGGLLANNSMKVPVGISSDPDNSTLTGRTHGRHLLVGVRKWYVNFVETSDTCEISIVTTAYEQPRGNPVNWGAHHMAVGLQMSVWTTYLNNINSAYAEDKQYIGCSPTSSGHYDLDTGNNPDIVGPE